MTREGPQRTRTPAPWRSRSLEPGLVAVLLGFACLIPGWVPAEEGHRPTGDRFGRFELPPSWRETFWKNPNARALREKCLGEVADLVPVQAGLRFCRCPACGAEEQDDPLAWSIQEPEVLKCRRCGVKVPNADFPAKVDKAVPEEKVEVQSGVLHHYPYHAVAADKARYPDERLYLQARRDYEARKFLARAALYAAVEHHETARARGDQSFGELACVILLRFAQVYPGYAIHCDQPGRTKSLEPARLQPPFRMGYQTAKWEWSGSIEVPLNLVMACGLLRGDPAWAVAGRILSDPDPERTVDRDLLRATAEFARQQPEEFTEQSLYVYQGMLAVGRLLDDQTLVMSARDRLAEFLRRGFYHDGFWRQADSQAHRRIVEELDGWIGSMIEPSPSLALARQAGAAAAIRLPEKDVRQASWPGRPAPPLQRRPALLGGAGVARLAVGEGDSAFDFEVRGLDSYSGPHFQRLAIRMAAAGQPVLDDLDELGGTTTGWDLATPSHNTVVVDGLNQRESPAAARTPAAGSDFQFFAADADFQVVAVSDPRAYPQSTTRYRQTVVVSAGPRSRYAVSVFEVHGGLQHDQIYHVAPGRLDRWRLSVPLTTPPATLLPRSITFLPSARREDGRWFVQSYGEFRLEGQAILARPVVAGLSAPGGTGGGAVHATSGGQGAVSPGVRLHLLGDMPAMVFTAVSSDLPRRGQEAQDGPGQSRGGLILRRRSLQGETLRSTFVTVFEPVGKGFRPLGRIGRVSSETNVVTVLVETESGIEYIVVNLNPGATQRVALPGGRYVSFDGVAVRVRERELVLAGGTFAEGAGKLVSQPRVSGAVTGAIRRATERGLGWFLTPETPPNTPAFAGRTLVIEHGDGTCRSWTLDSLESLPEGTRLHVREEPGFMIDERDGVARYYQFPHVAAPGPHRFSISQIAR